MRFTEISKKIAAFTLVISLSVLLYVFTKQGDKLSLTFFQVLSVVIGSFGYLMLPKSSEILRIRKVSKFKMFFLLLISLGLFMLSVISILAQENTNRGAITLLVFSIALSLLIFYGIISPPITSRYILLTILLLTGFISTFYVGGIIQYQDDPGAYLVMTKSLITHSKVTPIPLWFHHYGIPNYNIWQAILLLVPEIHEANLQLISTVILVFNFLLLSYILFKKKFNKKIAYVAMVLSLIFPITLKWAYVQDSRAFAMIFILLGLISYLSFEKSPAYIIILILSWFSILNSHYFYSLVFVILIFIPLIVLVALPISNNNIQHLKALSRWIIMLAIISYVGKVSMYRDVFSPFVLGFYKLLYGGSLKNLTIASTTHFTLGELLMYLPFLVYVSFSIIGGLLYLENFDFKSTEDTRILLSLISLGVLSIPLLKMGMYMLNPRRIFYFLGLIFGLLSSIAIWRIIAVIRTEKLRDALIFVIALFICFLSISSNLSNQLDPVFYSGEYPVLYYHASSEKYSIWGISNRIDRELPICSDYKTTSRYVVPMWMYINRRVITDISDLDKCSGYAIFSYIALNSSFLVDPNTQYAEGTVSLFTLRDRINRKLLYKDKIYDGVIVVYSLWRSEK
ncbi:hypothetical protein PAP_09835 [Palaeococcus pacificus DY20341]|uniref:Uncharacterized protein n=1 Tax=Palaeococcus pacificus DY20341 TaxID=1343739 RepID=A0A075LWC9_9EURY|nr:hypothetical protein [Palaeococcus pacificus]AIF70342.1 hypothetical protein PAP_09835 [Palaeococcus pacificus DY20341]